MQSYHFLQAELLEGWYRHVQWLAVGYITGEVLFAELKSPLIELHILWIPTPLIWRYLDIKEHFIDSIRRAHTIAGGSNGSGGGLSPPHFNHWICVLRTARDYRNFWMWRLYLNLTIKSIKTIKQRQQNTGTDKDDDKVCQGKLFYAGARKFESLQKTFSGQPVADYRKLLITGNPLT